MMDGSTVTAVTVVLVPWDEAQPLQSMMLAEEGIARRINSDDPINVISSLLIRPTADQTPGLYVHHEPAAAAAATAAQQHPNVRATRLAMACGLFSHRFHGDVILSCGQQLHHNLALGEISAACGITSDLRPAFELAAAAAAVVETSSSIAEAASSVWLGNAARNNYHDAAVLSRLAQVMNRPNTGHDNDEADSVCSSDTDDDDDDNTSEHPKNQDPASTKKERFVVVSKVPLCLHCRRPASQLCQGCSGAYFCEPPATCRKDG